MDVEGCGLIRSCTIRYTGVSSSFLGYGLGERGGRRDGYVSVEMSTALYLW